jgi:hypothetical protein
MWLVPPAKGALQGEEQFAVGAGLQPVGGERRPKQVAADALELGAGLGADGKARIEVEAVQVRVARARAWRGPVGEGRRASRRMGLPARSPVSAS